MDTKQQHHQKNREKVHGEKKKEEGEAKIKEVGKGPPSATSSPSHEFSFTISLHSSSTTTTIPDKTKSPSSFAIDLSPADDIFFHGHLLPLHLLSHLPVSPRSSTNSLDSFTLPIRELLQDQNPTKNSNENSSNSTNNSKNRVISHHHHHISSSGNNSSDSEIKGKPKSKPFSLFNGIPRWRKGVEVVREKDEKEIKQKRKLRFDVSHVLKRYVRMVRPLLLFRGGGGGGGGRRRGEKIQFRRQPYSFSGNLNWRGKPELRGRNGEFSAPASMRTSPTNSGLLVATTAEAAAIPPSSSTNDSTMEELQAAIQAAIAHCKKSIAVEEKTQKTKLA